MRTASERQLSGMPSTVSDTLESRLNALRAIQRGASWSELRSRRHRQARPPASASPSRLVNRQLADVHRRAGPDARARRRDFADHAQRCWAASRPGASGVRLQLRALLEQLLAPGQYHGERGHPRGLADARGVRRAPARGRRRGAAAHRLQVSPGGFPAPDRGGCSRATRRGSAACAARLERVAAASRPNIISDQVHPPAADRRFRGDVPAGGEPLRRGGAHSRPVRAASERISRAGGRAEHAGRAAHQPAHGLPHGHASSGAAARCCAR